jgi:hypothetical protein
MRFTLLSLLALCGFCSVLAAVCFALPIAVANGIMALATLTLPAICLAGALYAPNSSKPFFVGASVPFAYYLFRDSGTEFHVGQQLMISLYTRFRGAPDSLAPAIESAYFLTQTAVLIASLASGLLSAFTVAALRKKDEG